MCLSMVISILFFVLMSDFFRFCCCCGCFIFLKHLYCSAHLSISYMEKCYRNKISIIVIMNIILFKIS